MMESKNRNPELIIVGGGIGGAALALRAAQYHIKTVWFAGDKETAKKSRAKWVYNIDNMIGLHADLVLDQLRKIWSERPELLQELEALPHLPLSTQGIIDNTIKRLGDYQDTLEIVHNKVTKTQKTINGFEVSFNEEKLEAPYLALSTGLMDRQPLIHKTIKSKDLANINWIYPFANKETVLYCIRCEGHLTRKSQVAMIGHNETTAQIALMLKERYQHQVFIVTNGKSFKAEPDTLKLLDFHKIQPITKKIVDLKKERPGELQGFIFEDGSELLTHYAFVNLGTYEVYHELATALGAELAPGANPAKERRVLINSKGETSVLNLFCVGDMAVRSDEPVMMQVYTAQEYAVRAVDTIDMRRRKVQREKILL